MGLLEILIIILIVLWLTGHFVFAVGSVIHVLLVVVLVLIIFRFLQNRPIV